MMGQITSPPVTVSHPVTISHPQVSRPPATSAQGLPTENQAAPEETVPAMQPTTVSGPQLPGQPPLVLQSPTKTLDPELKGLVAMTTTVATTTVTPAQPNKEESAKVTASTVAVTTEDMLKNAMPSFLVPGISASSAMNVVQQVSSASSITPLGKDSPLEPEKVAEAQKMQQELIEKQRVEQQKLVQKQQTQEMMLKRQQEVQVRLQEEEHQRLMQKHQELQKLQEKHKQLQEQQKIQEEKEQHQKQLEHQKQIQQHLQQQFEQMQRHGPPNGPGAHPPPPMLSPGAMRAQRPSLPSPGANSGPRPPISAHHQMPPGAPFGLPGQHPGAIPIHPGHLSPGQLPLPMIPPGLVQDKVPTSMGQQMLSQAQKAQFQKVQAQMIAEQQAQIAKAQAQEAQAKMKQQAQQQQVHMQGEKQMGPGALPGPATGPPQPVTPGKKTQEQAVSQMDSFTQKFAEFLSSKS